MYFYKVEANSLQSIRGFLALLFFIGFVACSSNHKERKSKLIEYPVPFYQLTLTCSTTFYYGIETKRFILINNDKGAWLLYDKLIDPDEVNNLEGLDEYIYIQLDLEKQLRVLLEHKKLNFPIQYQFTTIYENAMTRQR